MAKKDISLTGMETITSTILGRVSVMPKGEYQSGTTYNRLDLVQYEDCGYIAKHNGVTNVTPTDGDDWMLLVGSGSAELAKQYTEQAQQAKQSIEATAAKVEEAKFAAETAKSEALDAQHTAETAAQTATTKAEAADTSAQAAESSANVAESWANQAQSWAVGTGYDQRENQEIENSKAYAEKAQQAQTSAKEFANSAEQSKEAAALSEETVKGIEEALTAIAGGDIVTTEQVNTAIEAHNQSPDAHSDIRTEIDTDIEAHNQSPEAHSDIREKVEAATSKHWDITIQDSDWESDETGSFASMTSKFKATAECEGMTSDTDISGIVFLSGDRASAATWAWLAPGEDSVTLYATTQPSAAFSLRLTEVK